MEKNARSLLEKNSIIEYGVAALFYAIFCFLAFFSFFLQENIISGDIMSAHTPMAIMASDAIKSGTFPLWNPLLSYGTPYYAMMGDPVFYPTTILLELVGYTPFSATMEYVVHVFWACLGMYAWTRRYLQGHREDFSRTAAHYAALFAGLLYGYCGLFLSNAMHIMIVISAAWVPWILLLASRYCEKGDLWNLLLAGAATGMLLWGGYPEYFAYLFIFLVPFFLFYTYNAQLSVFKWVVTAAKKYLLLCLCTILSGAGILFPFLRISPYLTRAEGIRPSSHLGIDSILSAFFPDASSVLPHSGDQSMLGLYVGLFTLLTIPLIFSNRKRTTNFYLGLCALAAFIAIGQDSFFQPLMYRLVPMFNNFRFPAVARGFLCLFIIMLAAQQWAELLTTHNTGSLGKTSAVLAAVMGCVALAVGLAKNWVINKELQSVLETAGKSIFLSACFFVLYYILLHRLDLNLISKRYFAVFVLVLLCAEVLTFTYQSSGTYTYEINGYSFHPGARADIDALRTLDETRNRSVDFSDSTRTRSRRDSWVILEEKTFDEEGYVSVQLKDAVDFKESFSGSINAKMPEIFFTEAVSDQQETNLEDWLGSAGTAPGKIFVGQAKPTSGTLPDIETINKTTEAVIEPEELFVPMEEGVFRLSHDYFPTSPADKKGNLESTRFIGDYRFIRLYYSEYEQEDIEMKVEFLREDNLLTEAVGIYSPGESDSWTVYDIYFPNDDRYTDVTIHSPRGVPDQASFVTAERIPNDDRIQINSFSYNTVNLEVAPEDAGYLVLMQSYYPGWNLYVNGSKADIEIINGAFMGVYLEPGAYEITFAFRPLDFFVCMGISGGYYLVLIVVTIFAAQRYIKRRKLEGTKKESG